MAGKVTLDVQGAVALLTIENAGRLNAMDDRVAEGLAAGVAAVKGRADVGALILRGAGHDAFCAGVDLKFAAEFGDRGKAFAKVGAGVEAFLGDLAQLHFPSIALIHGVCYGGGVHLAVSCDFRFAAQTLRFAIPAVKNKLLYPIPALERLMRLAGPSVTRRLVLEGAALSPERLLAWGVIDELAPAESADEAAMAFAERLAAQPRAIVPHYMKILRAVEAGRGEDARHLRDEARRLIQY
jgi:enoyl-CoA hydratase/carnithine racemase